MAGPYRGVNMVIEVNYDSTDYTVGLVEGLDIDLGYEGGPEPKYGSREKSHSAGSKRATFTITRWYYTDVGQEDLLLDLFTNETSFTLKGHLVDKDGDEISDTEIQITGCRLYRWRPRTGGADDILGEEASGSGTGWTMTGFDKSTP